MRSNRAIDITEINARQDQVLNELELLEQRIIEIIEIWTSTDSADSSSPDPALAEIEQAEIEQAA